MALFTATERIAAPASVVWRYFADPEAMARWMPGIDAMRSRDGQPLGPGSEIVFHARGAERTSRVETCQPERELTLTSTQGPITATYRYRLEPEDGATRVTLQAQCRAKGLGKLIVPLVSVAMRRVDGKQLVALNQAVAARR